MRISVINHTSGVVPDRELQRVIRAINQQIHFDFKPAWHKGAELRLDGHVHSHESDTWHSDLRGDAILYLWDEADNADAAGFHDLAHGGIPHSHVFVDVCKQLGEHWSITLSHEALEMLVDPEANLLVVGPHPGGEEREVFHWYEVCDAVQDTHYEIDGVAVSNFVLPLYFTGSEEFEGRNDFLGVLSDEGHVLTSFGIAPGGYVGFYDPVKGEHDTVFGSQEQLGRERWAIKAATGKTRGARRAGRGSRGSTCRRRPSPADNAPPRPEPPRPVARDTPYVSGSGRTPDPGRTPDSGRRGFKIEGPFGLSQPVHEVLTLLSLREALAQREIGRAGRLLSSVQRDTLPRWESSTDHEIDNREVDPGAQQFLRGVIWPDDPEGLLFDEPFGTTNYSSGLQFGLAFLRSPDRPDNLTARSHFGDLQFVHAMAPVVGQAPTLTLDLILAWARFCAGVATREIRRRERAASVTPLNTLLAGTSLERGTVASVLGHPDLTGLQVRQRAAGILLHLVQDSFAAGHVARDGASREILRFRCYVGQDHREHHKHDVWAAGRTLAERVERTHGALEAVHWGARLLTLLDGQTSCSVVMGLLERDVLRLSDAARPSNAGHP